MNPGFFFSFLLYDRVAGPVDAILQTVISLFYEGVEHMPTFYFLLIGSIWSFQNASVTAIYLFIFSERREKSSPFVQFINSLVSKSTISEGERCTL